jgi:hypothetical protein
LGDESGRRLGGVEQLRNIRREGVPGGDEQGLCAAPEYQVVTVHDTPPVMSNIVAFTVIVP